MNYSAVAVYRGSWEHPDVQFADAVARSIVKGTPNFDLPTSISVEFFDIASETPASPVTVGPSGSARAIEERERGWSSALFAVRASRPAGQSNNNSASQISADKAPAVPTSPVQHPADQPPTDGLFVARSSDRKRN